MSYLIGRQPILNRNEEVVGYELLFRSSGSHNSASFRDASYATASVIIGTLSGFGLERILGAYRGFINLDLELLMSDSLELLPRERVVLELLENLRVTPELIERCLALKEAGFVLALDDHIFDAEYEELYRIVEIVKIDLLQTPVESLAEMVRHLQPFPVKLLAEKVETREEFRQCLALGFEYFQGFYFATPSIIEKRHFDEAGANLLKLVRLVEDDADIDEIVQTFRSSPGMTYKLLLLVNSVSLGLREKIRTVQHAVAILGRQQIKRWAQLALFASDDNRGIERDPLVDMAAVRAALMEQLARCHPELKEFREAADKAFMVGILSLLETIYSISMDEVIANLNLSEEIGAALTLRSGLLGKLLDLAEMIEGMHFEAAFDRLEAMGISHEELLAAQVRAYNWRSGLN